MLNSALTLRRVSSVHFSFEKPAEDAMQASFVGSVLEDARDANASNNAHEQRRDYVITVVAIQLTTSFAQNMYAVIKKLYNEIGR
jgi:hypothetical protein